MNTQKAIEIKERYYKGGEIPSHSDYREADRLSIEAMKTIDFIRTDNDYYSNLLLPGETKE